MMEKYKPTRMPSARKASRYSRTKSLPAGVLVALKSVSALSHRQKPSWCLAVNTAYFIPACLARRAHSPGLNSSAVKAWKYFM